MQQLQEEHPQATLVLSQLLLLLLHLHLFHLLIEIKAVIRANIHYF